eukprot:COSAG01_NODE_1122_length_11627_cov_25.881725_6_plen_70_part_00
MAPAPRGQCSAKARRAAAPMRGAARHGCRAVRVAARNLGAYSIVNAFRYLLRLTALYSIRVIRAQKVTD